MRTKFIIKKAQKVVLVNGRYENGPQVTKLLPKKPQTTMQEAKQYRTHPNAHMYLSNKGYQDMLKSEERRVQLQKEYLIREDDARIARQKLPIDYIKGIRFIARILPD